MELDCPHALGERQERYQVPIDVRAVRDSGLKKKKGHWGGAPQHQTEKNNYTSFSRRASSSSVCGGTYFAEMRRRALVLAVRLASGSSLARARASCRFFVFCPVYASLRRTASLYLARSEALSAQRLSAPRISALVLSNAIARASRSSASTAGALPLPLLFPFRIGAAVGDAISTSCGDIGDVPVLAITFCAGSSSPFVD